MNAEQIVEAYTKARKRKGISQTKLADKIRTTQHVVSKYEIHDVQPSLSRMVDMLSAVGLQLEVTQQETDDVD